MWTGPHPRLLCHQRCRSGPSIIGRNSGVSHFSNRFYSSMGLGLSFAAKSDGPKNTIIPAWVGIIACRVCRPWRPTRWTTLRPSLQTGTLAEVQHEPEEVNDRWVPCRTSTGPARSDRERISYPGEISARLPQVKMMRKHCCETRSDHCGEPDDGTNETPCARAASEGNGVSGLDVLKENSTKSPSPRVKNGPMKMEILPRLSPRKLGRQSMRIHPDR